MTEHSQDFLFEGDSEEVVQALAARLRIATSPTTAAEVAYYDTFDWRLWRAGGTLAAAPGDGDVHLAWRSESGDRHLLLPGLPAFACDLPAGPFRDALEPVTEMRRLLPLVRLKRRSSPIRVLDERGKTVARLWLDEATARRPRGRAKGRPLPRLLRTEAIKGYPEAWDEVVRTLTRDLGLEAAGEGELEAALAAVGRQPGDTSSKLEVSLDPELRADAAAKAVHSHLLSTLLANEEGTRKDLDSEFLHDFRVAVRRTRAALSQIKGVFPARDVERFRRGFSWLGKITGPTRDLDVYLLKIPGYRDSLPSDIQSHLDPLAAFLAGRQRREQGRLAEALASERYRRLIATWRRFLGAPVPGRSTLPNARRPVLEVASERIRHVYRRCLKRGSAIHPGTPAKALHRLRIDCKRLRYLMEFFRGLYEPREIGRLIKDLKKLQDCLGDFNDLEVQSEALTRFAREMVDEGLAPADTLLAMGRLVAHLDDRQAAERQRFEKRFRKFSRVRNRARAERLFAAGDPGAAPG